jgi:hypothetical protein
LETEIINLLTDLKIAEIQAKFIRCDNAGENRSMTDDLDVKNFGAELKFSGPRIPQRKGEVETMEVFVQR